MNGFDATKEIRRIEQTNGTTHPVVIIGLSGNAREMFSEMSAEVGMDDYVVCFVLFRFYFANNLFR